MKKMLTCSSLAAAGALWFAVSCGTPAADAEKAPREQLLDRFRRIEASGRYAFGHHDDPVYGCDWVGTPGRSDVRETAGDWPGVMNWDLGGIESVPAIQIDGVSFERMRAEVQAQHARGGINTFSWHLHNPLTGGNSWDCAGGDAVAAAVDPDTPIHDTLTRWIIRAADFLGNLRDPQGRRIPVVFRPWHEHTGSWFWWGRDWCSPEHYKALWHLTRRIFDERGIDNVLWAYSPDAVASEEAYLERYPDDAYVDVLGADAYHFDAEAGVADYLARATRQLDAATAIARRTGKLVALTETGSEGIPMPCWFTEVLQPLCARYPIVYVCVWRNAHDRPGHFYAPCPGHPATADFRRFREAPETLFASDLQSIE